MNRVRWTRQASNQLDAIYDFIAEDNPKAAFLQVAAITKALKTTATFPSTGRIGRVPETRELVVPNTPYIAAYRIHGSEIEILGIYHGAQQWPDQFDND